MGQAGSLVEGIGKGGLRAELLISTVSSSSGLRGLFYPASTLQKQLPARPELELGGPRKRVAGGRPAQLIS